MNVREIAIIGGGIAGFEAAVSARKTDPRAGIIMITEEEHPLYTACALADYVCGDIPRQKLFLARGEDYERHNIAIRFSTRVNAWDPAAGILVANDSEIRYDKLIIATGSRPFIPPIPGTGLKGVHTLKTLRDADLLKQQQGTQAVVVGSGPVGIEAAIALQQNGFRVTIIEQLHGIMPLLFDRELSGSLGARMHGRGIDLCLGERAREIAGVNKVEGIRTDQRTIPADAVVFAIGMRPEVELAKAGTVALGDQGGIKVDEFMQTSLEGVYACGDCVEFYSHTTKQRGLQMLWNNARMQGRIAGANAAGAARRYSGNVAITNVDVFDQAAAAVGLTSFQVSQGELKTVHRKGHTGELYLVFESNRLAGVQAIGDTRRLGGLLGAIMRGDELAGRALTGKPRPARWPLRNLGKELAAL